MIQGWQIEDLSSELECPICCEYLKPPIRMCTSGHSICDRCRQKIDICPFCESDFSKGRNVTLESLAQKIKYPCMYTRSGCLKRLKYTEYIEHEKNCTYKDLNCLQKGCFFKGTLQEYIKHCKYSHAGDIIPVSSELHLNYFNSIIYTNNLSNMLLKKNDNYFWLRGKVIDHNVFICVQLVGNTTQSSRYKYKFNIRNGHKSILFKDTCKSIYLEDNDLFKNKNSFCLSLETSKFYALDMWKQTVIIGKTNQDNNSFFSWYKALFLIIIIAYLCQYLYSLDYDKFFTDSHKKQNKIKFKHKYQQHDRHNYEDFKYEIWTILIGFVLPTLICAFVICYKILRKLLTIFGL